jgi:hypothetical protein
VWAACAVATIGRISREAFRNLGRIGSGQLADEGPTENWRFRPVVGRYHPGVLNRMQAKKSEAG